MGTYSSLLIVLHVEVTCIVVNLVVVLVFLGLDKTLVAVGVVGGSWRCAHVSLITLLRAIASLNLLLSVLVESKEGNHKDLVVSEGAEDEKDKAKDCLPVEVLEAEQAAHDPNDQST